MQIPDQTGKRIVVTGANSGLGLESVKALYAAGATVVFGVRDLNKGEKAAAAARAYAERDGGMSAGSMELARLDLADLGSVRRFAEERVRGGGVDVLMNNAGLMLVPHRELSLDGFEMQMGVNHLGHFALTAQLLPALIRTGGRVVSLTSMAHRMTGEFDPRLGAEGSYAAMNNYAQSKLACALFGFELDRRLKRAGLPVTSVVAHPGYCATALFTRQRHPSLSDRLTSLITPLVGSRPRHGVRSQLRAATDQSLTGGELIGPRFIARGHPALERPASNARSTAAAIQLWDVSATATGVDFDRVMSHH